jgi:hypothetical protein
VAFEQRAVGGKRGCKRSHVFRAIDADISNIGAALSCFPQPFPERAERCAGTATYVDDKQATAQFLRLDAQYPYRRLE